MGTWPKNLARRPQKLVATLAVEGVDKQRDNVTSERADRCIQSVLFRSRSFPFHSVRGRSVVAVAVAVVRSVRRGRLRLARLCPDFAPP